MMISLKQNMKLISVVVLCFCAAFVCTAFMNYAIDINYVDSTSLTEMQRIVFDGQKTMSKVIVACAGGVMGAIAVIVLVFIIFGFIEQNQSTLGVLKGLGYSEHKIAVSFMKFGLGVLTGCILGFIGGYGFSPFMYKIFNNGELPNVILRFHASTLVSLVFIPFVIFSVVAYLCALLKLKKPPLAMIREVKKAKIGKFSFWLRKWQKPRGFLKDLKRSQLYNNLTLIFFVGIAGFGFSAQIQIAFLMREVNMDFTFSAINLVVGVTMGLVTLIMAVSYLLNSNRKYIAMLKAYGYTDTECSVSLFSGYRIVSYIGFAIGTVYQYYFMKFMISLFAGAYDVEVDFNVSGFFITLIAFIICYETILFFYRKRLASVSLKEIMIA